MSWRLSIITPEAPGIMGDDPESARVMGRCGIELHDEVPW